MPGPGHPHEEIEHMPRDIMEAATGGQVTLHIGHHGFRRLTRGEGAGVSNAEDLLVHRSESRRRIVGAHKDRRHRGAAAVHSVPVLARRLGLPARPAGRLHELREAGANQSIRQTGIFSDYLRWSFDLPVPDDKPSDFWVMCGAAIFLNLND